MSAYKTKVKASTGENVVRYFNNFWTYRVAQITTGNMKAMRDASIEDSKATPVHSDLQPHGIYKFRGEEQPSVCVAIPKSSPHGKNLTELSKISVMAGHTDPQIFHWFKLLGAVPPRSIMSGKAEVLDGDLKSELWEDMFVRHPAIHDLAQKMWETNESKTAEEVARIKKREAEEDEKRMRRMSGVDWRAKHKDRERNPTREEDEEKPIYVMKPDTFDVVRVRPDMQLWADYGGDMTRVWDSNFGEMDPLARHVPRFLRLVNTGRAKLLSSINMNYNMKLSNVFIFDIDKRGMRGMGTQEDFQVQQGEGQQKQEQWAEYRFEFGKDQVIETDMELEYWVKGLMRLGAPETGSADGSIDNADPADMAFRH